MTTRAAAATQTRERMLEGARRLLRDNAYAHVTLQRIAKEARVSTQTVLLHFGTKEGVVTALNEWWGPKEEALREVPEGDVDAAARALCSRYEELGPATLRFLAIEDHIESVRALTDQGRAGHRVWVERTFGRALHGSGALRERRIMELVAAFDLYTWHVLRGRLGADATAHAMAELAHGVLRAAARKDRKGART